MKKTEFLEYQAAGFNIIPVVRPVEMVDEDPITLFEKLRGQHNNFLLESVEGGERWAQFSILGFNFSNLYPYELISSHKFFDKCLCCISLSPSL